MTEAESSRNSTGFLLPHQPPSRASVTDHPMSAESNAPADLNSLGLDLTEMFRPSWTKEGGQPSETSRLAASFGEDDRGDRPRRGDRDSRGPRRDDRPGRDRGPRPERPGGDRNRGPRRDSREGGRREDRGPRRHEERELREPAAPPPALEGWKLDLVPEHAAIEGIAKQVRSRAKAYPLFELSRLILKLSDRYSVKLTPLSEETQGLFRAKLDGSLWTSRKEAVDHLLSEHLGTFYRRSTVATEPPKGAFTVVAQCGMSGVLLGPPNHHEYTSKVIALHGSRFKNMPFEVFKSRIKMVRDEALIEQWKTEQSTKTIYTPVVPGEEAVVEAAAEPVAELSSEQTATEVSPEGAPTAEAITETALESSVETPAAVEEAAETAPASEPDTEAPAAEESGEQSADAGEESPTPASSPEADGLSFSEITTHFLANHADEQIEPASGELTLSGRAALHGSTKLLRELLLRHLRDTDRFPLTLAQSIGKELTSLGLQLFKSHKKIIHVSMARPRYLDRQTTPIGENFKAILEYLESHPNQRRDKQWTALLALRTETVEPGASTTPVVSAEETSSTAETTEPTAGAESAPVAPAPAAAIDEATLKRREQALGADLLWLLHQGHVIDFAMGNLQAATPPKPQPQKKEKAPAASKETSMDETLTGDLGEVQSGGSAASAAEESKDVIHEPSEHHEPLEIPAGTVFETPPPSEDPGQVLPN